MRVGIKYSIGKSARKNSIEMCIPVLTFSFNLRPTMGCTFLKIMASKCHHRVI